MLAAAVLVAAMLAEPLLAEAWLAEAWLPSASSVPSNKALRVADPARAFRRPRAFLPVS